MKKNRFLWMAAGLALALVGCGHTHDFETTWSHDQTYHWHACKGCDEVSDKGEHVYVESETLSGKRFTCSSCGYSYDKTYEEELLEVLEPLQGGYCLDHIDIADKERVVPGDSYYGWPLSADDLNLLVSGKRVKITCGFFGQPLYLEGSIVSFSSAPGISIGGTAVKVTNLQVSLDEATDFGFYGEDATDFEVSAYAYEGKIHVENRFDQYTYTLVQSSSLGVLNEANMKRNYTVTFDTDGGNAIESLTVPFGSKIKAPENPQKDHCIFENWLYAPNEEWPPYRWEFNYYRVMKDLTLTATYRYQKYHVSIDNLSPGAGGVGLTSLDSEQYSDGDLEVDLTYGQEAKVYARLLDADHYAFDGWYDGKTKELLTHDLEYEFVVEGNLAFEARWTLLTTITVTNEMPSVGSFSYSIDGQSRTVSEEGMTLHVLDGTEIDFTAYVVNNNYSFKHWAIAGDEDTVISEEASFTYTVDGNANIVLRWKPNSYRLTLKTNIEGAGNISLVSGSGVFGETIVLDVTINDGYYFEGYYDAQGNCLQTGRNPGISMATTFTLTINKPESWTAMYLYMWNDNSTNNAPWPGESLGSESSVSYTFNTNKFKYFILNNGSSFDNNQTDDYLISSFRNYTSISVQGRAIVGVNDEIDNTFRFVMPSYSYTIVARFSLLSEKNALYYARGILPKFSEDGKTVTYGLFPQSVVLDEETITALNNLGESAKNANGWYEFENEFYAREYASIYVHGADYVWRNGTSIQNYRPYWFKCEPIVWDVLSTGQDESLLVSRWLLDCRTFGQTNNYLNSNVRTYLTGAFHSTAFSYDDSFLLTTTLDNGPTSTDEENNPYLHENCEDKVFLLSVADYENVSYGFPTNDDPDDCRMAVPTDYALARGAMFWMGGGCYWTRTPSKWMETEVRAVRTDGAVSTANDFDLGIAIRPAITIKLDATLAA